MPDYSHTNAANCDIVIDDSSDGEGGHEKRQDKAFERMGSSLPSASRSAFERARAAARKREEVTRLQNANGRLPAEPPGQRGALYDGQFREAKSDLLHQSPGRHRVHFMPSSRERELDPRAHAGPVAGGSGARHPIKPPPRSPGPQNLHDPRLHSSSRRSDVGAYSQAPPAPKPLTPEPELTPEKRALATILSIVPDVQPEHVLELLQNEKFQGHAEAVLNEILSNPLYPKVEKSVAKGKKRARDDDAESAEPKRDYLAVASRQRPDKQYETAALHALYADFPTVAQNTIASIFKSSQSFYAPAHVAIKEALAKPEATRGWKIMSTSAASRRKGKAKDVFSFELESERVWLLKHLAAEDIKKAAAAEEEKRLEEEIASGAFFECGCCFGETALSQLISCSNGCSFCKECATANANNQVGMRKFILPCMSVDGCASVFPEAEYHLYLPQTTISALHKIKQEKELALAELDDLETCPFCPFAMCVDNPHERLFRCQREDCMVVSCRKCKKEDHLPFTCEEADKDKKIDSIHRVEEAMSEALIRRCPNTKCKEPYLKEAGCNKIICSSCRTMSCYICGKVVTGYQHFKNAGSNASFTEPGATCPLWDNTAERSYKEIEEARVAALAAVQSENPALDANDSKHLAVEKPPADSFPRAGYLPEPVRAPPAPPDPREIARLQKIQADLRRFREQARRARARNEARMRELRDQQAQRDRQAAADREIRRQQALQGPGTGGRIAVGGAALLAQPARGNLPAPRPNVQKNRCR